MVIKMELKSRFWIEKDGKRVFGKGPYIILKTVDRLGTLNKAADELNMSYSKAWSVIKAAEKRLGFLLLESRAGGVDGGGSELTPEARKLVKSFHDFCQEANHVLKGLYEKHFNYID